MVFYNNIENHRFLNENFYEDKSIITELKSEVLTFCTNFSDDPEKLSGWGHNYFCEEDGGQIEFDLKSSKKHKCTICGKVYEDEKRDRAWIYLYRFKAFEVAYKAALLYNIENDHLYLDSVLVILNFYADNYSSFEIHAKDKVNPVENGVTGYGKIMPQGLNEAIMLLTLINILEMIKKDLDSKDKEILNNFVLDVANFLYNQRSAYHNIICWMNSAVGSAGLYLNNQSFIESTVNSEFGLIKQLDKGLTKDNLWYEGSIHYHFFALEGILNFLYIAKIYSYNVESIKERAKKMLLSVYNLAFDNLIFPNPNDGWPNISLKTYSYLYDLAKVIFNDIEIDHLTDKINTSQLKRANLPLCEPIYIRNKSIYYYIFNDKKNKQNEILNSDKKSIIYRDSGFALLKNKYYNLFFKFAHKSQSHAHFDLLNIELTIKDRVILRDLSNPGYGSKLYDSWFKKSLSHNTVIVGGKDQNYTENSIIKSYTSNGISAEVFDAYYGTILKRELYIKENILSDIFYVECQNEQSIDYVLHFDMNFKGNFELIDCGQLYSDNGYENLCEIKKVIPQSSSLSLYFNDGEINFVTNFNILNKEIYLCKSFDNPSIKHRETLVIRCFSKKVKFEMQTVIKTNKEEFYDNL